MFVTAIVLAVLGILAIGLSTVPTWVRWPASAAWIALSYREIRALRESWRHFGGARFFANGDVEIRNSSGDTTPASLADGSILLRRIGWLRLVADDGTLVHELVRGSCREDRDWRRLHVIWRHV